MKIVGRSIVLQAAMNLIDNPKLWDVFPASVDPSKMRELRNSVQDYMYSDGTVTEVATCLAWVLGFQMIDEEK